MSQFSFKYYAFKSLKTIFFILGISNYLFSQMLPQIDINGNIWDDENGIDLACNIFGYSKGEKILLGTTDKKQLFNFYLPLNIDSLEFESLGFLKISLPVKFHGSFVKKSNVNISIKTKRENSEKPLNNCVYFCNPENQIGSYTVQHFIKDTVHCINNITKGLILKKGLRWEVPLRDRPTALSVKGVSESEELLLENKFLSFKGLNFVDLNIYSAAKDSVQIKDSTNLLSIDAIDIKNNWTIYFQQSKYDIDSLNVQSLNELLETLKFSKFQKIIISGFTDGVGNENLNQILGDYRSQTVAKYLSSHGIELSRLVIKKSDKYQPKSFQKTKNNLEENRKVEIKIIL